MARGQELQLRILLTIAMWDPMTGIFLNRETNAVRKFMNQQIIQKKRSARKDENSREKRSTHKMSNLCLFNKKG